MDAIDKLEMKRIDLYTQDNLIKSYDLMEEAGKNIYLYIKNNLKYTNVLLLSGSKGNGGDSFVVGRYLMSDNTKVDAYLISDNFSEDCKKNYDLFKGKVYTEFNDIDLNEYDLIIDGLLGIGTSRNLNEKYIDVIEKINRSNKYIVSIDIPSGIDASSGISYGAFIKSDLCLSVKYHKLGLFLNDGIDSYKEKQIIDSSIINSNNLYHINEIEDFKAFYKERLSNSNKGTYGKCAIIAGSLNYPGASLISYNALNAFKMGVGYSYLIIPNELYSIYALRYPELIVDTISSSNGLIKYDEVAIKKLDSIMNFKAIAIGMGMGVSIDLYKTIKYLLTNYKNTLIIDADGLNTIAKYGVDILKEKTCELIITPHLKEFSRLSNKTVDEIKVDSINLSMEFAKSYNLTLILKSNTSIITDGSNLSINTSGNTGLSKGGSGDTLSGILVGLSSYIDNTTYNKARLSSYILGKTSEYCKRKGIIEEVMSVSDLSLSLSEVISDIKNLE